MNYQLLAIVVFFTSFFSMKFAALWIEGEKGLGFLWRSPVFAPRSERRNLKSNQASLQRIWQRLIFFSFLAIAGIEFYQFLFTQFDFGLMVKAWIFSPYIYIFTNLLGVGAQCLGLLTKELPTDLHNHPYLAQNISEFWGKRWNIWVSDWLALISKSLSPNKLLERLFLAFLLSGIFHEVIVAIPYYLYSGENYFGLMTSFFMIQFLAVSIDKKILKTLGPRTRRLFLWFSLLAPMPLFINPSVMAFFGV
ncbi:MAG: hypothetical protein KC478_14430 [Bacteriovoracaceae bacterium]|nr:hypothetical protein [Bacteriovoracaceae bacterium]